MHHVITAGVHLRRADARGGACACKTMSRHVDCTVQPARCNAHLQGAAGASLRIHPRHTVFSSVWGRPPRMHLLWRRQLRLTWLDAHLAGGEDASLHIRYKHVVLSGVWGRPLQVRLL